MGKKILQIYAQKYSLSKPVLIYSENPMKPTCTSSDPDKDNHKVNGISILTIRGVAHRRCPKAVAKV